MPRRARQFYLDLWQILSPRYGVSVHAYRDLFSCMVSDEDLHLFRKAAHYCQPVGDDRFRTQIEGKYGLL